MLLTKCNQFNIKEEDCLNSTYLPRNEYNAYLNSFNVPIIKDDYCNEGKCVAIIYKDENKCAECRDKSCFMNCKHLIHTDNFKMQHTQAQGYIPSYKNVVVQKQAVPIQQYPVIKQEPINGILDCVGNLCDNSRNVVTITKELTRTLDLAKTPESTKNKIVEEKTSTNTLTVVSTVVSTLKKISIREKSSISTVTVTDTSILSKTRTTTIENVSIPSTSSIHINTITVSITPNTTIQPHTVTVSVHPSTSLLPQNELPTSLKTITITSTLDTGTDTKNMFKDIKEILTSTKSSIKREDLLSTSVKSKEMDCDNLIDINELEKCLKRNTSIPKKQSIDVSEYESVVTVTREIPTTVTVESPITLYREVTTTAISEVPIINYKVTTFTKRSISTSTIEKSVTVTSTKESYITESIPTTEYKTSTVTSTVYSTITNFKTTTSVSRDLSVSTQYSTVYQSSVISKTVTIENTEGKEEPKSIKEKPERKSDQIASTIPSIAVQDIGKSKELTIDIGTKDNVIKQLIDNEEKKNEQEKPNVIIKTMYETLTSTIVRPQITTKTVMPPGFYEQEKSKFSRFISETKEDTTCSDGVQKKTIDSEVTDCKDCTISKTVTKTLPQTTTTISKPSEDVSLEKIIPLIKELIEEKSKKTTKRKKGKKRKVVTTTIVENPQTRKEMHKGIKTIYHTVFSRRKKPKCRSKKVKCINCENLCEDSEEIYQTIFKNV